MGKVNQLQEAMTVYPDVKPRSVEWCLKLIDALFKSKRIKVWVQARLYGIGLGLQYGASSSLILSRYGYGVGSGLSAWCLKLIHALKVWFQALRGRVWAVSMVHQPLCMPSRYGFRFLV